MELPTPFPELPGSILIGEKLFKCKNWREQLKAEVRQVGTVWAPEGIGANLEDVVRVPSNQTDL
jgi:hypothetical protein